MLLLTIVTKKQLYLLEKQQMKDYNNLIKATLLLGSILTVTHTAASDQDLLDTLLENGVLNKAQYEKLSKQQEEKNQEASTAASISPQMEKALEWTSRIKIGGDMRFRHENIDKDDAKGVKESRQRIRARIKVAAKINDEVDAGFRLVTAGGQTSANQTLEGGFGGKDIFFDRAFINWHPAFAQGLSAIFGKFEQPWYNVSSDALIWDSDVNPEGVALKYQTGVGPVNLAATGGYFILEDGDTVEGKENNDGFSDDLNMYHAGISASMQLVDAVKGTIGSNAYIYNNEATLDLYKDGDSPFEIYEVAGGFDIDTGIVPIYVFAQYAVNASADDGEDSAWLAGFATKYGPFKLSYNYRDTQKHAVADTFNDSNFAAGTTAARGHKVGIGYKISSNFSTKATYFAAEEYGGTDVDTFQLDLKAKF